MLAVVGHCHTYELSCELVPPQGIGQANQREGDGGDSNWAQEGPWDNTRKFQVVILDKHTNTDTHTGRRKTGQVKPA